MSMTIRELAWSGLLAIMVNNEPTAHREMADNGAMLDREMTD